MLPSLQLARNTLAGKPGRLALMIGAVALSASLVVAISCAIGSVQASLEYGIRKFVGSTDARIIHPANGRFEDSLLEKVRSWPEVEKATARLFASITLIRADGRINPETGNQFRATPSALGVQFENEHDFRQIEIEEGRWPTSKDEILLDGLTAEDLEASVGDVLEVQRFGEPIRLTVSGIYERKRLRAVQRPLIEIDRGILGEATSRKNLLTSIVIILREGEDIEAFCKRHAGDISSSLLLEPAESVKSGLNRQIGASHFGFIVAAVLTFMSASFIIVTAMTTSIGERQRELAVTRCIGASRGQLFASQLFGGLLVAGAGALLGIPLGIGLTALLVWWFKDLLPAGLQLHPLGIQLALLGAAAAGLLGALYPAWMASRVSPLQAMAYRARPPRRIAMVLVAGIGLLFIGIQLALMLPESADTRFLAYAYVGLPTLHIGYFILAIPTLIALAFVLAPVVAWLLRLPTDVLKQSLLATPVRHGLTAGALMVGIAILVSTWSGMNSIQQDWLDRIRFPDGFAYRVTGIPPQQQEAIKRLPFVRGSCPIALVPLRVLDKQIFGVKGMAPSFVNCFGFDLDEFFRMNSVDWVAGDPQSAIARLKQGDSVIVADRFLTTQKVKIGDKLKLGTGKVEKEFEIIGAVNSAGLDIATQSFGIRNQYMEYSISSVFLDHSVLVNTFDNRDVIGLQLTLDTAVSDEDIIKAVAEVAPGVQFSSGRWILQTINEVMAALLTVESTVAFVALFLACLGTGNVILANIQGRRYEYGVLRAIGAHRNVLARLIFAEAAMLAIAGAIVGTVLGVHLAWVGAHHYRDLAGLPLRVNLPIWPTVIGWLVLIIMTMHAAAPGIISILKRQPSALLSVGRNG